MSYTVVIPARYNSSRLPGKPLLDIDGKSMVQRVWEQACKSAADTVVIATDDRRIWEVAQAFGAQAVMTSSEHPSGTARLQQVVSELSLAEDHIVVNVQGDEPLIPPSVIDQVADNLGATPQAAIATLCETIDSVEEVQNPNVVKVVTDHSGMALYFSRAAIPWPREYFALQPKGLPDTHVWLRHIGIYAYRVGFLHQYVGWNPAPLELVEQLEQLRALHNGVKIHVAPACEAVPCGVDTQMDLDSVRAIVAGSGGA